MDVRRRSTDASASASTNALHERVQRVLTTVTGSLDDEPAPAEGSQLLPVAQRAELLEERGRRASELGQRPQQRDDLCGLPTDHLVREKREQRVAPADERLDQLPRAPRPARREAPRSPGRPRRASRPSPRAAARPARRRRRRHAARSSASTSSTAKAISRGPISSSASAAAQTSDLRTADRRATRRTRWSPGGAYADERLQAGRCRPSPSPSSWTSSMTSTASARPLSPMPAVSVAARTPAAAAPRSPPRSRPLVRRPSRASAAPSPRARTASERRRGLTVYHAQPRACARAARCVVFPNPAPATTRSPDARSPRRAAPRAVAARRTEGGSGGGTSCGRWPEPAPRSRTRSAALTCFGHHCRGPTRSRRRTDEKGEAERGPSAHIAWLCEHVFVSRAEILHADLDAFYASVEQRDDPAAARPAGDRRRRASCWRRATRRRRTASARRWAARQARRLCPRRDRRPAAHGRPTSEASKAVFEVFEDTSPLVEGLSIDEAFLDVRGLERIAGHARARSPRGCGASVRERVGLPITVGVARTKFLAKVASGVGEARRAARGAARRRARVPPPAAGRAAVGRRAGDRRRSCTRAGIATVGAGRASSPRPRSSRCSAAPPGATCTRSRTTATRGASRSGGGARSIGAQRALGRGAASPDGARRDARRRSSTGSRGGCGARGASAARSCCGCASTTSRARPARTRCPQATAETQAILVAAAGLLAAARAADRARAGSRWSGSRVAEPRGRRRVQLALPLDGPRAARSTPRSTRCASASAPTAITRGGAARPRRRARGAAAARLRPDSPRR